jgi:hypothetical protein
MKKLLKVLALLSLTFLYGQAQSIDSSIVKIYTVSKTTNYMEPWNSSVQRSSGS